MIDNYRLAIIRYNIASPVGNTQRLQREKNNRSTQTTCIIIIVRLHFKTVQKSIIN